MQRTTASGMALLGLVFMVAVLCADRVSAQMATGTISGTVRDETGAVLPGVAVTVKEVETGSTRSAVTEAAGRYFAPNLALGTYEIRAELSGFRVGVRQGVTLTVGRNAVVDFALGVGDLTEEVTIVGEAALVDMRSASVGGLVEQNQIEELPLNGRSFGELTKLIPGVVTGSGSGGFQGGFTDNISIRGARAESNKILLDGTDVQGVDNKLPGSVGGLTLGVDSIREFKVEVGTYGAEFGRALGGVINVSTRSGTNQFHGTLFEFHRNDALDAKNFFDDEKPDFIRNQFGGALGGPIVRNRTFFFANVEMLRDELGYTSIAVVPTARARQGFLPRSGGGETNVGVAPGVAPYLALYPLPNGRDFGDGRAESILKASQPTEQDFIAVRLDQRFSDSDSAFVRYTFDDGAQLTDPSDFSFLTQRAQSRNQFVTVEEQKIVTPALFNTLRVGFSRNFKALDPAESTVDAPIELGFTPGYRVWDSEILVAGLGTIGIADAPRVWTTNKYQLSDQVVWRTGRQALKFGFEVIRIHQDLVQNSNNGGEYTFGSLQDLLRGTSRRFRARLPGADQMRDIRNTYFGWYVQDDVSVSSKLTLNVGLRHEVHTGPTEKDGKCANVDDIFAAPRVGCPLFPTFAKNFGPRLGFAWDVTGTGSTALRGGVGIYFSEMSASSYYTSMTNQPPFTEVADVRNPVFPNGYEAILKGIPQLRANPNSFTAVPRTYQTSLTLQRQLAKNTVATVGYAGTIGRNWITRGQENVAESVILPDGRKFFAAGQRPRSPLYNEIRRVTTNVDSSYHGLLVELRRRFSGKFSVQAAYTLSKATDALPFTTAGDVMDFYDVERDFGLSDSDVRHNFSMGSVWELPGPAAGVGNALFGGWQMSAIVALAAGRPFTPVVGFNISQDLRGRTDAERPNLVPGASSNPVLGGQDQYFDPLAFELQEPGFYGNLDRNTIIGPGLATVDFSLSKSVSLGGERRLQFRAELFNALNRANFGQPDPLVFDSSGRSPSAGRITSTTTTARQGQLGLKLIF